MRGRFFAGVALAEIILHSLAFSTAYAAAEESTSCINDCEEKFFRQQAQATSNCTLDACGPCIEGYIEMPDAETAAETQRNTSSPAGCVKVEARLQFNELRTSKVELLPILLPLGVVGCLLAVAFVGFRVFPRRHRPPLHTQYQAGTTGRDGAVEAGSSDEEEVFHVSAYRIPTNPAQGGTYAAGELQRSSSTNK